MLPEAKASLEDCGRTFLCNGKASEPSSRALLSVLQRLRGQTVDLCSDCYGQVKLENVISTQNNEAGMALSGKFDMFFDFFHAKSLFKEQLLALRQILHIPILVYGTVASPMCSWEFQSHLQG